MSHSAQPVPPTVSEPAPASEDAAIEPSATAAVASQAAPATEPAAPSTPASDATVDDSDSASNPSVAHLPLPAFASSAPTPRRPGRWRWWAAAVLVSLGAPASVGAVYLREVRAPVTIRGLRAGGLDVGGLGFADLDARLALVADAALDQRLALDLDEHHLKVRRRDLGVRVDTQALAQAARSAGRSGDPLADVRERRRAVAGELDLAVPLTIDRPRTVEYLGELKEALDRAPVDAHLDLDHHSVAPERPGRLVQVYESLARVEAAVRAGSLGQGPDRVELAAVAIPPRVRKEELQGIDISTVVGTWETHYNTNSVDSDRTYNLKVGAEKLNGRIIKPGELFSFNQAAGNRTEKEGYRVAPVISGGELIDGLAGGMCQIASTLHAAAFFAGMEIVSSTPHSRPSVYIPLGLDSTVVWPSVDLKLRNPFDFPVVLHYQVNQGTVKVEILGPRRPYKVLFEREILVERPFGTSLRRDPTAPQGQRLVLQDGYPGYTAIRRRYLFDAATTLPRSLGEPTQPVTRALARAKIEPLRVETKQVHYPTTEEIVAVGSGPKKLKKKDKPPSHRIPPVPKDQKPIGRILR